MVTTSSIADKSEKNTQGHLHIAIDTANKID